MIAVVLAAELGLDGPSIDAVVGQLEAGGVAQHVRVDFHIELSGLASALDHRLKARLRKPRLLDAFCTLCTFCIGSEKQRVDLPSML